MTGHISPKKSCIGLINIERFTKCLHIEVHVPVLKIIKKTINNK